MRKSAVTLLIACLALTGCGCERVKEWPWLPGQGAYVPGLSPELAPPLPEFDPQMRREIDRRVEEKQASPDWRARLEKSRQQRIDAEVTKRLQERGRQLGLE